MCPCHNRLVPRGIGIARDRMPFRHDSRRRGHNNSLRRWLRLSKSTLRSQQGRSPTARRRLLVHDLIRFDASPHQPSPGAFRSRRPLEKRSTSATVSHRCSLEEPGLLSDRGGQLFRTSSTPVAHCRVALPASGAAGSTGRPGARMQRAAAKSLKSDHLRVGQHVGHIEFSKYMVYILI
jgi:hypothetical protein